MKVNLELYGQFLMRSQINYTCTYLAEHFAGLTHDNVQYFPKSRCFTPRLIWHQIKLSSSAYLIFDNTVLNKDHSHRVGLVRLQYSGIAHGLIKGIGVDY